MCGRSISNIKFNDVIFSLHNCEKYLTIVLFLNRFLKVFKLNIYLFQWFIFNNFSSLHNYLTIHLKKSKKTLHSLILVNIFIPFVIKI